MVQGVGVLVITNTLCGDEITAAPHSARWTLTQFYLVPGCCPASTGQVATNQGPSLSALSVFPLAATATSPVLDPAPCRAETTAAAALLLLRPARGGVRVLGIRSLNTQPRKCLRITQPALQLPGPCCVLF